MTEHLQTNTGRPTTACQNEPQAPVPTQRLLTRQQVADRWNVVTHTIARNKGLHPVRFNRRLIRYRLDEVESIEAAAAGGQAV